MGNDRRSETISPEDDGLRELEDILVREPKSGYAAPAPEGEPSAGDVAERVRQGVLKQDQTRQQLRAARKALGSQARAFPDLLRALREAARLSPEDIAAALRTNVADVRRIENGEIDAFTLAPEFVASVMEVFSIGYGALTESLKYLVARRAKASGLGTLAARSTNAGVSDLERALHDVAGILAEEDGDVAKARVPDRFLEEIRQVLDRWGRDDLLRA
jgi:transcriptional regulator with XRE-family HTH domain